MPKNKYTTRQLFENLSEVYNEKNSLPNCAFKELLEKNNIEYSQEFPLENRSFDFKVNNFLIEIDPAATHNSTWNPFSKKNPIDKFYHQKKTDLAKKYGYQCIHVFDWDSFNDIINLIKPPKYKIGARKCLLKEIDKKQTDEFLNQFHLQGSCRGQKIRIGLFYNEELVSVMTFGTPRYNKKYQFELLRLCTKPEYLLIGGTQKMYDYFVKKYQPKSIISYCDANKFSGDVYCKLGMKMLKKGDPNLVWYHLTRQKMITDNILRQQGFDRLFKTNYGKGTSNEELMLQEGFVKIYGSGQNTYCQIFPEEFERFTVIYENKIVYYNIENKGVTKNGQETK